MLETTGLYKRLLEHLKARMLFAEELVPVPLASIGSVIANRKQTKEPFHWIKGDDEDLGVNMCIVSPSGFAKSFTMKQLLHKQKGICPFKSTFRGKITEAGFVGTITKDGETLFGDAYHYSDGILAFNEIANLFYTQQQEHSSELINQVMEALTERRISKRLSAGMIDYPTYVTIWGGIQPSRFDFSQGLGRRFVFVTRSWSSEDLETFKKLRLERDNVEKLDMKEVEKLRGEIKLASEIFNAKEIKWDHEILQEIESVCDSHLQMQQMERCIIGKETLNQYDRDTMVISGNDENMDFIHLIARMQKMVSEGTDISLLINVIRSKGSDRTTTKELWDSFRSYGYTLSAFLELLDTCNRLKIINTVYSGSNKYIVLRNDLGENDRSLNSKNDKKQDENKQE